MRRGFTGFINDQRCYGWIRVVRLEEGIVEVTDHISRVVSEAFCNGIWVDVSTVRDGVVVVRSLNRRHKASALCFRKASILRLDLRDATSSLRTALGKCSRRRTQTGCTRLEDLPPALEVGFEYRCGPRCIDRCLKATSLNHRIVDSTRWGGQPTSPSPSMADIQCSHIRHGERSRRVARTSDARRRKVPWHGLAWC